MPDETEQPRKSLIKRWWFWLILIVVIVFGLLALRGLQDEKKATLNSQRTEEKTNRSSEFEWPSATAKTITDVPIDLTQVLMMGKFRSCAGHDRSGYNFNRVLESDRAMKHYFFPIPEFQGTMDKIKIFAPFDGQIIWVQKVSPDGKLVQGETLRKDGTIETTPLTVRNEENPRLNPGSDVGLMSPLDENAQFNLNHIQPIREFKVGEKVKAGELIGYSSINDKGSDFDMDYVGRYKKSETGKEIEVLDSMFDHMTEPVLAEFAKYGITPQNIKFTKEERDAKPCGYDPVTKYGQDLCAEGRDNECWVKLSR